MNKLSKLWHNAHPDDRSALAVMVMVIAICGLVALGACGKKRDGWTNMDTAFCRGGILFKAMDSREAIIVNGDVVKCEVKK